MVESEGVYEGVCLICCLFLVSSGFIIAGIVYHNLDPRTEITSAVITSMDCARADDGVFYNCNLTINYTVDEQIYINFPFTTRIIFYPSVGDMIHIFYNPNNSTDISLSDYDVGGNDYNYKADVFMGIGYFVLAICILSVCAVIFCVAFRKYRN